VPGSGTQVKVQWGRGPGDDRGPRN
jgi:hypothetical protein